jgi:hypothetical protein
MMDWINMIVGGLGLIIAVVAIFQTRHGNRIAKDANSVAERALKMQEDQSVVRLVVAPKMLIVLGDEKGEGPRPVVTVINLSAFPVTVAQLWWKTDSADGRAFYWKQPPLSAPFGNLPARLESRQSFTAVGLPGMKEDDLLSVTAAVAITECGERVEGMTDQWRAYCEELRQKRLGSVGTASPGTPAAASSGTPARPR